MTDDERRDEQREADDGRKSPEEERDENVDLRDPWDGPASENAYPEDPVNDPDGTGKLMNDAARAYNRMMGLVDEAAHIPWTPENSKSPEGAELRFTEEQMARSRALQAEWDAKLERFERSKLKSASQLPDLDGEDLKVIWDFEPGDEGNDDWTVLRYGDRVIWREVRLGDELAPVARFDEILWILREKYGTRLASLEPTRGGLVQLRGTGYSARTFIEGLNLELRKKRHATEPWGSFEVEDADPDRPESESLREQLLSTVGEIGGIDCSCGWAGDATEARMVERGSRLELLCADCRRPICDVYGDE